MKIAPLALPLRAIWSSATCSILSSTLLTLTALEFYETASHLRQPAYYGDAILETDSKVSVNTPLARHRSLHTGCFSGVMNNEIFPF